MPTTFTSMNQTARPMKCSIFPQRLFRQCRAVIGGMALLLFSFTALHAAEDGFVPLLDAAHTTGWEQCGKGGMRISQGVGTTWFPNEAGFFGIAWYKKQTFRDFILRVEYRAIQAEYNSGLRLRFPKPVDPGQVSKDGYEVSILNADSPESQKEQTMLTGAIAHTQRPQTPPTVRPLGEWNEMEVTVVGQKYVVRLNGSVVTEFTGSKFLEGYVGIENHRRGSVQFRNVRIKELTGGTLPPTIASNSTPTQASVGGTAPAPAPVVYKAEQSQIEVLKEQTLNVAAWITSPLERAVPETIWENMIYLKEALQDELVQKPAASRETYAVANRLCALLVGNLEERKTTSARAGGDAVLHPTSNLTQQQRDHLTWPQYFLERDERAERQERADRAPRFQNGQVAVLWAQRTQQMRTDITGLYNSFRVALRESPKTK